MNQIRVVDMAEDLFRLQILILNLKSRLLQLKR